MPPKGTPNRKSNQSNWIFCDKCSSSVSNKDSEAHSSDCPPDLINLSHSFVKEEILRGTLALKSTELIKGISEEQKSSMVFLSQSAMQLCNLSIGDLVLLKETGEETNRALVCLAWPTAEHKVTSVLLTKDAINLHNLKENSYVQVSKLKNVRIAKKITVTIENSPKNMEITNEIRLRLSRNYIDQCTRVGNLLTILFYGKWLKLRVKEIVPLEQTMELHQQFEELSIENNDFYRINDKTNFIIYKNFDEFEEIRCKNQYQLNQLGGLQMEISEILQMIDNALKIDCVQKIKPIKGVLLYGQSGTGKTHLIKSLRKYKKEVSVVEINAMDLYSKLTGSVEENIRKMFQDVKANQPTLVLMDEIEILCPLRTSRLTETEKRIVSCVLSELDFILNSNFKVFVLGVTNKLESLEPSLRRCGRFDREIEIPVPNPIARLEILKIITQDTVDKDTLDRVSQETHGYVGADLITLCATAQQNNRSQNLNIEDFKYALTKIRPSAMREVQIEVPNVKWTDVGGQHRLKLILRQCVEWPLKHPESFERLGISPPRGVLMYGPPGCSKTMIAKALATESGLNFLAIKGPELFSKWVGESEKAIREVFRKARLVAPSIIFFDEIDALGGERATAGSGSSSSVQERVLAQLLTELDGITSLGHVTVLAATNRPDRIDAALLRPGRLDRLVYVSLPDEETRREIFKIKLGKMSCAPDIDVDSLVNNTENYSGAEINALCHEAAMMALEEDLDAQFVQMRHFSNALHLVTPRTSLSTVKMYEEYKDSK